jgi:hypothetical protein
MLRREAGIGQGRHIRRLQFRLQLDEAADGCLHERHIPAVAFDAWELTSLAVGVLAGAARAVEPAGDERVQDHGVADGQNTSSNAS